MLESILMQSQAGSQASRVVFCSTVAVFRRYEAVVTCSALASKLSLSREDGEAALETRTLTLGRIQC